MSALYRLFTIFSLMIFVTAIAACNNHDNKKSAVLLFNGTGTSPNDVAAIEVILDHNHVDYSTVNSAGLNAMKASDFAKHRLLIVPGGNFIDMGKSLDTATTTNIRQAVQHGLNYFGVCAGAFLAGHSDYYHSFNLTSGVTFGFYSAANKGVSKTAVAIDSPDGSTLDQYWENGPQLSGWGDIVAKYPDHTPAVVEGKYGKGFVILSGIHAEAPEYWRGDLIFKTSVGVDNAYAVQLINAALKGTMLSNY